ncbi:hypothetical protein [Dietzia kunjamensis]|uniref:hypothetical protein n=1 Tax=Dietzia kunjamensis TaxID=322509 RepID=UPI0032AFDC0F
MNDEQRQTEVADEVEAAARQLAHSTRNVPNPPDSYALLGSLGASARHLAQVAAQLSRWHDRVTEGTEHVGEDDRGDGTGIDTAATALRQAAAALHGAARHIESAHSANGVVRWVPANDLIVARPMRFSLEDYSDAHGIAYDVGTPGFGLFGDTLHEFPEYTNGHRSKYLHIKLHGPIGGPGNLVVTDTTADEVWLYREQVTRHEAVWTIEEGMARAKQLGRDFEHTDMPSDFHAV